MCWILIYSILKAACLLNGSQHSGKTSPVYNSDYMVVCCFLVSLPGVGPLRIETCRNIKCDITIEVSKEQVCAFCWFRFVNLVIDSARDEQ